MSALYARFAVQKNEIRRTEGVVHPKIFSPPSNLKLSVELVEEDISDLEFRDRGIAVARKRKKKKLYGWAVISECDIRSAGLRVVIDNNPKDHANILDWTDNRREQKRKEAVLAKACQSTILPKPICV